MGVMKRILENQMNAGRGGGLLFTNENPEITMPATGVFSGVSGAHLLDMQKNVPAFNAAIRGWGSKTANDLRTQVRSRFTHGKKQSRTYKTGLHSGNTEKKLVNSLAAKYKTERGGKRIETIGFALERHGVFLQKGVGRGYVMQGGGVARIAKSDEARRYRFQSNWFNQTLDKNVPELSTIIVKHMGDAIVLNTKRMYIQ